MKLMNKVLRFALLPLFVIIMMGCAGSKSGQVSESEQVTPAQQNEYSEIEQLLGISPADRQTASPEQGQDDLLSLLQANEGDQTAVSKEPAQADKVSQLEQEVTQLNRRLEEKDKTISLLKAQVMAMEEKKPAGTYVLAGGAEISDQDYELNYQQGYDLIRNRQYRDAIRVFESLLAANTKHSLSDNAQYWIGECYYALGDYRAAVVAFEKVFTFANSNKNDYAQYKLGLCYYKLNDMKRAKEEFQSLVDNYKNPDLISKAEEYLAKL